MLPRINLRNVDSRVARTTETANTAGFRAKQQLGDQIISTGKQIGDLDRRRREEEARDITATQKASDRLNSAAEFEELKTQFRDDPLGFRDALMKTQNARRKKVLSSIDNPIAQEAVKNRFEISELENGLVAASHERTQFTANMKNNIINNATIKSTGDFNSPPSGIEFQVDLEEDVADIEDRDMSQEEKNDLVGKITKVRVQGAVNGYIKGGRTQDFLRAEQLVSDLGPKINSDDATKLFRRIDIERTRAINSRMRNERLARTEIGKQFEQERGQLRDVLTKKMDGGDIDDDLKKLSNFGKIRTKDFSVLKESEMNETQVGRSGSLKLSFYDQISRTNKKDIFTLREEFNKLITTGQMSAEDGVDVMDAISARENSPHSRAQKRQASKMMKESVSTGFGFNKKTETQRYMRMEKIATELVLEEGVNWDIAAKVAMKEEGLDREFSLKEDQLLKREKSLKLKLQSNQITKEKAMEKFRKLKKQREMLDIFDNIPSLKELRGVK